MKRHSKASLLSYLLLGLATASQLTHSQQLPYHQGPPTSLYEVAALTHRSSPCVLSIKSYPANSSNSYSAALAHAANSYLSNYASSARPAGAYRGGSGSGVYKSPEAKSCITQRDVELAVEEARASLGGYVPKEIHTANSEMPKPMHVTVVAEIITQATRILANRFKLPEPAILYDLPSVDLSKSPAIDKICPLFLKPNVNCDHSKFRTLTGFCNNLQYQSWGSTRSAMVRFLAPDYYDSISLPRRAYDGSPLPSARVVSFVVHQDPPEYDKYHSMLSVVWGQFIDHDMTLAVQATDENPSTGPDRIDCCKSEDSHPDCFPIEIPKGDPFYGYFNQKCMHFTRASPGLQPGCSLGPVQAMNKISSYMDGSLIYGNGISSTQRLRSYHQGQLRTQPVNSARAHGSSDNYLAETLAGAGAGGHPNEASAAEYLVAAGSDRRELLGAMASGEYGRTSAYKELLPALTYSPELGCERRGRAKDVYCFEAGDVRANEQIQLTTMHTMLMREHNRLAKELSYINPYWDDERLFQEARQIVIAQLQHITFNEFLPLVIGKEKIYEYGLELEHPGRYYQGYDSKINAGIRVEFQAAAFRYGHSILPSYIERYNKFHQKIESIRLSKLLKQPYDLYYPGVLDTYLLGLVNQRSGRMDPTLTTEVTNHLFEKPGKFFGIDLAAINIQRGRDMGVPGYNHFRDYCGLPRAKYFEDLTGVFSNKTLLRLSQLYKHVDDIDLWTAGIAEYPIPDGLVGPTFACLIARQFVNLRRGDRFWYENDGYPAQFTLEQLDEIRKSTAARLVCDNSDDIDTIQASAMLVADPHTNPRVSCHSLPTIDLGKWKELGVSYPTLSVPAAPIHGPPPAPVYGGPEPLPEEVYGNPSMSALAEAADDEYPLNKLTGTANAAAGHHYGPMEPAARGYDSLKMNSHHFVDHLVDVTNYRPELASSVVGGDSAYDEAKAASEQGAASAAAAAAAA